MTPVTGVHVPAVTTRGAFPRLLAVHGTGTAAQVVLNLAMGVHVLDRTGSGVWVSSTVALSFAPYALFSSVAGVVVDRSSRSTVLGWCCRLRAVLTAVLAIGVLLGWPVQALVLLTAVVAAAATPSYPALTAAAPQCVPAARLPAANALATGVENATWIAAPGLFGAAVIVGVPTFGVVATCAAGFGVAAAVAGWVRLPAPPRTVRSSWWSELAAVLTMLRRTPGMRRPLVVAVLDNLLYGYLVVALVLVTAGPRASGDGAWLGAMNAALAGGALVAMTVVTRLVAGPTLPVLPPALLAVFAGCVAGLGLAGPGPLGVALVAVAGATTLVAEVASVTLLQRAAGEEVLGRVFGVYDQLNVGAVALGSLLAGPAAAWWGARPALVVVPLVCAAPALWLRRVV